MSWFRRFLARPWWTMLKLTLYTMMGKPYFKTFIWRTEGGQSAIDAHHNVHFIYELDRMYAAAGSDYYNQNMDDQAKVAIYLYDTLGNIAENYMPPEQVVVGEDDIGADVPPLAFRGGEEVRQVVDLAEQPNAGNRLDVEMG